MIVDPVADPAGFLGGGRIGKNGQKLHDFKEKLPKKAKLTVVLTIF